MAKKALPQNRVPIKQLPSAAYLRSRLNYDPCTGVLRWRERPLEDFPDDAQWSRWNGRFAGKVAGSTKAKDGCLIGIDYQLYRAHRIIWKLVTGRSPLDTIDHADANQRNNSIANLRIATQFQQKYNSRLRKNNTSGYRGVRFSNGKWQSDIRIGGVRYYLGRFETAEDASAAYESVAVMVHGKFYRRLK